MTSSAAPQVEPPAIEGATHRYTGTGELRVHYAEAGAGEPVLLLHGWPQHHHMWRDVIAGLRERHRLIAPDLRGFGWSEAPGHGYDAETFACDQVALLDALGIDRVRVIGHDWGGWTGFLLALEHPERIASLVALNVPHPWPRPRARLLLEAWRSWYAVLNALPVLGPLALRSAAHAAGILRRGNGRPPFSAAEIQLYARQFRDPARAAASSALYRYYLRALRDGVRGRWRERRIELPVLSLFGTRDLYIPAGVALEGYRAHAPRMRAEAVPGSGHFIANERPELIARRALEHFERG